MRSGEHEVRWSASPILGASITLGIGLGGFFDGILFHQILQIHNMLSARIPPETLVAAKTNMVWDGLFHLAMWVITVSGIVLLSNAVRHAGSSYDNRLLMGGGLIGWGLFNVIEGLIDHHILHIHHVYEPIGLSMWDFMFLGWGVVMIVSGWWLTACAARAVGMNQR